MAGITAIKPQKNKKRVNVYLDGKFGFGIDLETLMKLKVKEGTEVSEEKIKEIVKKAEFQKTLDKLLRFVSLRPRSVFEIKQWLKRKRVHESLHDSLFNRLKRLDLVDDEKFASWWVEQRLSFRPKSKRVLNQELRIKGISKDVVNKVLDKIGIDELKIARKLVEKKAYRWRKLKGLEKKKKISEFLARKGFCWEVIRSVIDDF